MSDRHTRAAATLRSLAVLAALAASVLLAACGGGSARSANSAAAAESRREQQFLAFTKCLREHGIDVSTPTAGGPVKIGTRSAGSVQRFEAARNACRKYAPADRLKLTPQQRVEREEGVRKFAKCMREHGIQLEAGTSAGGGEIKVHIGRGQGGPNPESPTFEAAQKTCQSLLPKPPGGFRPGGPGGPSTSRSGAGGPAAGGPKLGLRLGG